MNKKVSILLSLYNPNREYLKKQLVSLNNQTYDNLELIVWNDCPQYEVDKPLFAECIKNFPYKIYDQKINLGYSKAFEKLVSLANGYYVCFCDQDDIWENEKITECISALERENGTVAVCDKSIIDENDNFLVKSVKEKSKWDWECWSTGDSISSKAIFMCYATGMSIHARKDDVEKFVPFVDGVAHDRWIMATLSALGKAVYVDKPLVRYRRHGNNVTGVLSGINSKSQYYSSRCDNTTLIREFEKYFPDYTSLQDIKSCNEARMKGNILKLFKFRNYIPNLYKYEILLSLCPDFIFKLLVKIVF